MGLITKINGLTYANTAKYSGVTKVNTKKVGGTGNFHNKNAASKSISTDDGSGSEAIFIADTNGDFRFTDDTACSFSFWIKPGWNASLNTSVLLLNIIDTGSSSVYDNGWRVYFNESNNRIYFEFSSGGNSSNRRENFWHFHDDGGLYDDAHTAAGTGSSNWSSANRGNVGNDDYTLITVTKGTANSSLHANFKLYWNATDCGAGFYRSGSGGGTGTANLGSTNDKKVVIGANAANFANTGNNAESKYMNLSIWDKELSSSEVSELYNSGAPLHVGTHSAYAASCVGWYPFQDDGTGEVSGNESFAVNGDSNLEAK
jgi:hypothetical protein